MLERAVESYDKIKTLKKKRKFSANAWIRVSFDRKTPRVIIGDGTSQIELTMRQYKILLADPLLDE